MKRVISTKNLYNKSLGRLGERKAAVYLQNKGFHILELNFKARYGEVDIVARSPDDTLVFVEVKTRIGEDYGEPVESVTPWKLREVVKTAEFYLLKHNLEANWRIDVVAVSLNPDETIEEIEHFENVTL